MVHFVPAIAVLMSSLTDCSEPGCKQWKSKKHTEHGFTPGRRESVELFHSFFLFLAAANYPPRACQIKHVFYLSPCDELENLGAFERVSGYSCIITLMNRFLKTCVLTQVNSSENRVGCTFLLSGKHFVFYFFCFEEFVPHLSHVEASAQGSLHKQGSINHHFSIG